MGGQYRKFGINPNIECSIGRFAKMELEIVPRDSQFNLSLPKSCKLSDAVFYANFMTTKVELGKRKALMRFAKTYVEGMEGFALHAIEAGKPKLFYPLGKTSFLPAEHSEIGFFGSGKELYTFDTELLYMHRYELREQLGRDVLYMPIINAERQLGMLIAEGEEGKRMRFKCCGNCGAGAEHDVSVFLEYMSQVSAIFSNMMFNWFDKKTGLLNAAAFEEELWPSMKRWVQKGRRFSILFLDLDRFKAINDNYGHLAGDDVLRAAAKVLVESTKSTSLSRRSLNDYTDMAVRWGGDEFIVILQDIDAKAAGGVAKRIISEISQIGYANHKISASVGIVDSTQVDILSADGMLRLIDSVDALHYSAKERGKETGSTGWLAYLDSLVAKTVVERFMPLQEGPRK